MKVAIRDIPCHRRFELSARFIGDAMAGMPIRTALERPDDDPEAGQAAAEVDLYVEGDNVFARGKLDGWLEVACGRCVGPVRVPMTEALNVTFVPPSGIPTVSADDAADEDEDDVADDDMDVYPYDGEEVDLAPLLREQVVLSVPFAPLCREDCQGLCSVCGTDLNQGSCSCERVPMDPRWSALKTLQAADGGLGSTRTNRKR